MESQAQQQQPKPLSALEQLEALKAELNQLTGAVAGDQQAIQYALQKTVGIENAMGGIAKTLAALVGELQEAKLISNDTMMARIRKMDEDNERGRIQDLVKSQIIKATEQIQADSLVILSQNVMHADGKVDPISGYRAIEMVSIPTSDKSFLELLGKRAGDSYKVTMQEGKSLIGSVVAVYEHNQSGGAGEVATPPAGTDAPAQPEESSAKSE